MTIAVVQEKASAYAKVPPTILGDSDDADTEYIGVGTKVYCNVDEEGNISCDVFCVVEGTKVFEGEEMINGR